MDPRAANTELASVLLEVGLAAERDKTRVMRESLRTKQAELEAKKRKRSMLLREKDQMIAVKPAGESLVAKFLEADTNKNYDHQTSMKDEIVALMICGAGNKEFDQQEAVIFEAVEALVTSDAGDGKKSFGDQVDSIVALITSIGAPVGVDGKAGTSKSNVCIVNGETSVDATTYRVQPSDPSSYSQAA